MAVKCLGCKFAEWKRTSNGRLHPDQSGRCNWSVTIQVPPSIEGSFWRVCDVKDGRTIEGGKIWRDSTTLFSECKVFQPTPKADK